MTITAATVGAALVELEPVSPISALNHWDSNWYRMIAAGGYWYTPGQQSPVAFFPLLPLCLWALSWLGLGLDTAGVVLSLGFGLGAVALYMKLARRLVPPAEPAAQLTLLCWPLSFYLFGVVYADGLFLLLVLGAFLAVEDDHPVLAAVLGGLACAARPLAPAVALGLVARSIERRLTAGERLRPRDLLPALSSLGLFAFMAHLALSERIGNALAFAEVQAAPGWDQPAGWSTWLKIAFIDAFRSGNLSPLEEAKLLAHALAAVACLALLLPTWRRLGFGYALYALGALGMPLLASKDFVGMGRYAMGAFPLFLTAGALLHERPRLARPVWIAMASLLLVLAFAFGGGAYLS